LRVAQGQFFITFFEMPTFEQVVARRAEILRLAEQYKTTNVRVFGSVARREATEESDIDFLISAKPGCTLFDLGGFHADLEDLFRCEIDLVTETGIMPRAKANILKDAVPI
jgi:predicted nucleotidyltransferase